MSSRLLVARLLARGSPSTCSPLASSIASLSSASHGGSGGGNGNRSGAAGTAAVAATAVGAAAAVTAFWLSKEEVEDRPRASILTALKAAQAGEDVEQEVLDKENRREFYFAS